MSQTTFLFLITLSAIGLLLLAVIRFKLNAFIALLLVSIYVGIATGMPLQGVLKSIQDGMGGILGFVATIVGLGAIFGIILEASGGAEALARSLLAKLGEERAPWALTLTGFIVSIPIFLDVGFIILVPIVYALARKSGKSCLLYAIPLLAGMAVTHAFIPPTPGPVAVAEILSVPLGWVILFGAIIGAPTAAIAGPYFGRRIARKIMIKPPPIETSIEHEENRDLPSFGLVAFMISLPLLLILVSTFLDLMIKQGVIAEGQKWTEVVIFLGHPFSALIIATLSASYWLGTKRGFTTRQLLDLSTKALGPAGLIILITGAGGVFKQVLVDSGIGNALAATLTDLNIPVVVLAYVMAVLIRVTQGSATVAMITSAGLMAPVMEILAPDDAVKALVVISIAAGATIMSHVNDSGFWLVCKYLGMTEKQTLQSWTTMVTIVSLVGFGLTLMMSLFV